MSDDESIMETIATQSSNESEDETGRYIDDKSNVQLFTLLKSIRNDDPKLYENPNFFKEVQVDKKEIMDDYFNSLIEEKKKPKKNPKEKSEKEKEIERKANIFLKE